MKRNKPALSQLNATVLVLSQDGEQAALVRPRKRDEWVLPGGKIDAGESVPVGALREVAEETGLTIRLTAMTACYQCVQQDGLMFLFLGRHENGELLADGKEIRDVRWVLLSELEKSIDCPLHRQRASDCLSFQGAPIYRLVHKRPFKIEETWDLGQSSPKSRFWLPWTRRKGSPHVEGK
ncbi:MAG: NUDIX hydrolase [Verrucomicrobiota bacterium]